VNGCLLALETIQLAKVSNTAMRNPALRMRGEEPSVFDARCPLMVPKLIQRSQ
jgi:hypothetical protein